VGCHPESLLPRSSQKSESSSVTAGCRSQELHLPWERQSTVCSMPIAAPFTSTASRLTGESVRYTAKLRSARDPPLRLSTSYRLTAVNQTDTGMVTKPGAEERNSRGPCQELKRPMLPGTFAAVSTPAFLATSRDADSVRALRSLDPPVTVSNHRRAKQSRRARARRPRRGSS
jgi:hypothetical protein